MQITTCVFSYNRGKTLENLIKSAEITNWVGEIIIYDDCSNDPYTLIVLERLQESGYEVKYSEKKKNDRLGGLYSNMTEMLNGSRGDYIMFLQDDMQFVRAVDNSEILRICELLEKQKSPFLFPSFFTKVWSITKRAIYDPTSDLYSIIPTHPFGGASDVCIFNRKRLLSDGWVAFVTEQESDRKACQMYGSMTVYPDPFVAFIPFPPIPRMNILKRLIASRGVLKIVRYREMDPKDIFEFKRRDKNIVPIDTVYLKVKGGVIFNIVYRLFGIRY